MKKELKDRIVNLFDIFNVCESLFTQRRKKEFINLFNITVNILIKIAINIIDFIFAPIHIIKRGPNETFGSEFKIVKYGSSIFDKVSLHQRIVAIIIPKIVDRKKLIIVSYEVTNM